MDCANTRLVHQQEKYSNTDAYLKAENLKKADAFKIRGAYCIIHGPDGAHKARGIVSRSAGSHARRVRTPRKNSARMRRLSCRKPPPKQILKKPAPMAQKMALESGSFCNAKAAGVEYG